MNDMKNHIIKPHIFQVLKIHVSLKFLKMNFSTSRMIRINGSFELPSSEPVSKF